MSQLNKLQVSGVRSFGPDEQHIGMLKFYPLTLILGPNGAGKTSLIEALRYVTSGETPPNSSAGRFWVHNPKIGKKVIFTHNSICC